MTGHLKILALALGLAVAGGSIAQAATPVTATPVTAAPVADQTARPTQTSAQTKIVKPITKHAAANVMLRKHHLSAKRLAHLRHLRKLHEARMLARHHTVKTVAIHKTKIVKAAHIVKTQKTVMAHHAAVKPVSTVR